MIQQSRRVEEVVESFVKYTEDEDGIKLTAQIVDGNIKSITFRFLTPVFWLLWDILKLQEFLLKLLLSEIIMWEERSLNRSSL